MLNRFQKSWDVFVVGGGPAGLATAVYAASEGLSVVMVDARVVGGQAGASMRIENYLGFPTGISGKDLTRNATIQAQRFGARVSVPDAVVGLRLERGQRVLVLENGQEIRARCVNTNSARGKSRGYVILKLKS